MWAYSLPYSLSVPHGSVSLSFTEWFFLLSLDFFGVILMECGGASPMLIYGLSDCSWHYIYVASDGICTYLQLVIFLFPFGN
jgi:hypothetical protein